MVRTIFFILSYVIIKTMFTEISGLKIEYNKVGNGKITLIFVHGWGGSINSLKPLYSLFVSLPEFTVLTLSLPGFGNSVNPLKTWGVYEYADLVKKFVQKFATSEVIYIGHSFGGGIGLYLSATDKKLFKKLVLLSPAVYRTRPEYKGGDVKKIFVKKLFMPVRYIWYRIRYPESQLLKYPALEENFKRVISQDLSSFTTKVEIPTLIMWANDDSFVPLDYGKRLHKEIYNSRFFSFENGDHGFPIFKPAQTFEHIISFIKDDES